MVVLRVGLTIIGLLFGGLIIWASVTGDFWAAGNWLTTDPWGIVTLADLYFGFLLSATVIGFFERDWKALFWIAPIPFLGNVWVFIWFVLRLPDMSARFSHAR